MQIMKKCKFTHRP